MRAQLFFRRDALIPVGRHDGGHAGKPETGQQPPSGGLMAVHTLADIVRQAGSQRQSRLHGILLPTGLRQGRAQGFRHPAHGQRMAQAPLRHTGLEQQALGLVPRQGIMAGSHGLQDRVLFGSIHIRQHGGIGHRYLTTGNNRQRTAQAIMSVMGKDGGHKGKGQEHGMPRLATERRLQGRPRQDVRGPQQGQQRQAPGQGHVHRMDEHAALLRLHALRPGLFQHGTEPRTDGGEHAVFRAGIADSAQAPAGCRRLQQPRMMPGDHEALPAKSVHPGQTLQSTALPVREGQRQQGLAPSHAGRRTGSQYQSVMAHDLLSSLPPLRGCVTRNPCPSYSMRPSTGPSRGNGLPQAQGPSSRLAISPVR